MRSALRCVLLLVLASCAPIHVQPVPVPTPLPPLPHVWVTQQSVWTAPGVPATNATGELAPWDQSATSVSCKNLVGRLVCETTATGGATLTVMADGFITVHHAVTIGSDVDDLTLVFVQLPSTNWSIAQLTDFQGDLMLRVDGLGPQCPQDATTRIKCTDDRGVTPHGILNGWVWTIWTHWYDAGQREQIYRAALSSGYTHFALDVGACHPNGSYHQLQPLSQEDCDSAGFRLTTVLQELHAHRLIPICAGVAPDAPPANGVDLSLCPIAMTDWDNTDLADSRLDAIGHAFPPSTLLYFELAGGLIHPSADAASTVIPTDTNGGIWLRSVQVRWPNFKGVLYETEPDTEATITYLQQAHPFWRDVQEVNFEKDTYWKFWENLDAATAQRSNDEVMRRVPWLRGCLSGCSSHPAPSDVGPVTAVGAGELDLHLATIWDSPQDLANWAQTTTIRSLTIASDGVYVDFNARDTWPEVLIPDNSGNSLQFTLGVCEQINGAWNCSAAINFWKGLPDNGGNIAEPGQLPDNWFYDQRWGVMQHYQPHVGELIGVFVCAGICRDENSGALSPARERSNVVLVPLPDRNGAHFTW